MNNVDELRHRRWIGRIIRIGLVGVAIAIVIGFVARRAPRPPDIDVQWEAPSADALGPGDARIYSRDSSVNLILQGENILAGLSPKTVAKIRAEIDASATDDTSGLAGSIAKMVKDQVADKIGTHVVYPLRDIRDIRYENEEIVIEDAKGNRKRLFGSVKMNKQPLSESFPPEDAKRFVELVRARKQSLP